MSDALNTVSPEADAVAELNPEDAQRLGVQDGSWIALSNNGSAPVKVKAVLNPELAKGLLWIPNHFESVPVNRLFKAVLDPDTRVPVTDGTWVRIERVASRATEEVARA